jgi:hypothetical protein
MLSLQPDSACESSLEYYYNIIYEKQDQQGRAAFIECIPLHDTTTQFLLYL